jgi:hypothetical protein
MVLPTAITGSYPRPLWFDRSLDGRSFGAALGDSLFREQHLDAEPLPRSPRLHRAARSRRIASHNRAMRSTEKRSSKRRRIRTRVTSGCGEAELAAAAPGQSRSGYASLRRANSTRLWATTADQM